MIDDEGKDGNQAYKHAGVDGQGEELERRRKDDVDSLEVEKTQDKSDKFFVVEETYRGGDKKEGGQKKEALSDLEQEGKVFVDGGLEFGGEDSGVGHD